MCLVLSPRWFGFKPKVACFRPANGLFKPEVACFKPEGLVSGQDVLF